MILVDTSVWIDHLHRADEQLVALLGDDEVVMALIDRRRLWAHGLSAVDARLIGAVSLMAGARLWTRDTRLISACHDVGVSCVGESRGV